MKKEATIITKSIVQPNLTITSVERFWGTEFWVIRGYYSDNIVQFPHKQKEEQNV